MTKTKKVATPKNEVITPEGKIAEIQKDIVVVEKQSQKMAVVKSEEDVKKAVEFLGQLKSRFDRLEELRLFFVKEPTQHISKVNTMFREQKVPFTDMIGKVKKAVGSYRMAEELKARKEEERLAKLQEAKNKKREEAGKEIDLTPAPIIKRVEKTIETESGKSTAKKVWKFEIEAVLELPLNMRRAILFLAKEKGIIDTIIKEQVKNGVREIKGVKIYEDFDVNIKAS